VKHYLATLATVAVVLSSDAAFAAQRSVTLAVDGMTCSACPYIVKQALSRVPGVSDVKVSFEKKMAVVTFDDEKTDVTALTRATSDLGFPSRAIE
jgi:mercuric ion binding protein